jgi:hypothetical protein
MSRSTSPHAYIPAPVPSDTNDLQTFLKDELQKVSQAIEDLRDLSIQVAYVAPSKPRIGMIRFAVYPWRPAPAQTHDALVFWSGIAWVYLPLGP